MTDNVAVLEGYTREIMGEYKGMSLFLLVKPDTQLDQRFKAWNMDMQEFIHVNGWLTSFDDVEGIAL